MCKKFTHTVWMLSALGTLDRWAGWSRRAAADWPWVELVHSHAGADARQIQALVAMGVKGLVVVGTGNGSVHHSLLSALVEAQTQGVVVCLATRCSEGQIVGQPTALQPTRGLNGFKARVSCMLDLMA